jgi:cytochrome c oxidase assembly protein subunit 15
MSPMPSAVTAVVRWRLSPVHFRRAATWAVWAVAAAVVSGASVRLTGSGLGCSDWPSCTAQHVVAPLAFHPWMEFGNRLLNVAVTVVVAVVAVAAVWRAPRRRDLLLLSGGLIAGVLAEAVVGGVVVLTHLAPQWVTVHFLVSFLLLSDAVVLRHRARLPDRITDAGRVRAAGPSVAQVARSGEILARLLLLMTAVVVMLGTVVTSTGPHGGDPRAPRFHFSLHSVAQLHGTAVESLLAVTLLTVWVLFRTGAPRPVLRRAEIMIAVMAAQAVIGYTQYFSGDPALLVGFHVAGALSVVTAVLWFNLNLRTRPAPVDLPVTAPAVPALTAT